MTVPVALCLCRFLHLAACSLWVLEAYLLSWWLLIKDCLGPVVWDLSPRKTPISRCLCDQVQQRVLGRLGSEEKLVAIFPWDSEMGHSSRRRSLCLLVPGSQRMRG